MTSICGDMILVVDTTLTAKPRRRKDSFLNTRAGAPDKPWKTQKHTQQLDTNKRIKKREVTMILYLFSPSHSHKSRHGTYMK